jgi:hypothetical protein
MTIDVRERETYVTLQPAQSACCNLMASEIATYGREPGMSLEHRTAAY